jgi:starch synthase/alpha-amylase
VGLLVSGVFAAHFVNTVSPTFPREVVEGRHDFVEASLKQELASKTDAECAVGVLNAPDPSFDPADVDDLVLEFAPGNHTTGKRKNKRALQKIVGLHEANQAPLFFWPSRLGFAQKGCQLLAEILYDVVLRYWEQSLQIVFVANGALQHHFDGIEHGRIGFTVCGLRISPGNRRGGVSFNLLATGPLGTI